MRPDYDTVEGIRSYLKDGLSGLHRLIHDRRHAGPSRQERLDEFVILGRWRTDARGNFGSCTFGLEGLADALAPVVRFEDLSNTVRISSTMTYDGFESVGPLDNICNECGEGWTLENAHDVFHISPPSGEGVGFTNLFRHFRCHALSAERSAMTQYRRIVDRAGLQNAVIVPTPNDYWPDGYTAEKAEPWCLIKLPRGNIRMGWRKRVITIRWDDIADRAEETLKRSHAGDLYDELCNKKRDLRKAYEAETLFPNDNVTKSGCLIHAWGEAKAVEYLMVVGFFGYRAAL